MQTLQTFDFRISALGPSSGKYSKTAPDTPMPSPRAQKALYEAVDELKVLIEAHGFTVINSGYGVIGIREIDG